MDNELLRRIIELKKNLNDRESLIHTITYGTGPVLEGVKPSALLNFTDANRYMNTLWKNYRDSMEEEFSIKYMTIDENDYRSLVLFYDEKLLENRLSIEENSLVLWNYGYRECIGLKSNILRLKEKFHGGCPHEVGIFLGIPSRDVKAFIENGGKNYLFSGYWKVYFNPEESSRVFRNYDNAIIRALERRFSVVLSMEQNPSTIRLKIKQAWEV